MHVVWMDAYGGGPTFVGVLNREVPCMDTDRIARTVADPPRHEIRECLRAVDLFELCGLWTPDEAAAWREAVRARAAELSEPIAEA
jgi:hypothetical protein